MLFEVVKSCRGRDSIVFVGDRVKAFSYARKMTRCQAKGIKGRRVEYIVRPSESNEKFRKSPHRIDFSGGSGLPSRIKN